MLRDCSKHLKSMLEKIKEAPVVGEVSNYLWNRPNRFLRLTISPEGIRVDPLEIFLVIVLEITSLSTPTTRFVIRHLQPAL